VAKGNNIAVDASEIDESRLSNNGFKSPLRLRNRDSAVKMTTVGLNENSGWPNRRTWIKDC